MRAMLFLLSLAWATPATAHGFVGAGFLHPLTGFDHMLAILAVGAWSAVLGRPALWRVPAAFLAAMVVGGAVGLAGVAVPGTEIGIAISVVLLGAAIAWTHSIALPLAAGATLAFGAAHGFAHGVEIPNAANPMTYVMGFTLTTAGLHIIGMVGAALIIERRRGLAVLRGLGGATALAGVTLLP